MGHRPPEHLRPAERSVLDHADIDIAVSVATFWELSIKLAKGMLRIGPGKAAIGSDYFAKQAHIANFSVLPIHHPEAEYVRRLPRIHDDPFDRLIIAQALLGGRTIITRDKIFAYYPSVLILTP